VYPFGNPFAEQVASAKSVSESIPTLLSRRRSRTRVADERERPWEGTFLGLEPMAAWLLRFLLTYAYAGVIVAWFAYGYRLYRRHYRRADWTPTDDVVRRLSSHSWGKFGLAVVLVFLVMALFAPTLGPTTSEQNIENPYSYIDETLRRGVRVRRGDIRRRRQQRVGVTGEPGTTTSAPGRTTTSGGSIRSGRYRTERTCSRSWCTALASRCSSD